MENGIYEMNLDILKEKILDEQQLVTYISLSKELCIHVNKSKLLLDKFAKDLKKRQPHVKLNVNYIISGLTNDHQARTTVCTEQALSDLKNSFQTIFFCHVYSISDGIPSVDKAAYMAINKFEDISLCSGLVRNELCAKHSSDEIINLKSNSQNVLDNQASKSTQLKSKQNGVKVENSNEVVAKIHETKSEPVIKKENLSNENDAINDAKQKTDKAKCNKTQKGIAGFFNKSNSVPHKTKVVKDHIIKSNTDNEENKSVSSTNTKMEIDEEAHLKQANVEQKENAKPKSNSKNKSIKSIKKNAKVDSKRKRVLHVSDSESEDENNDDPFKVEPLLSENVSDDEIPPTPSVNAVKITSGIVNPKKKRKTVDKTYTDEDGYILTKKEEIYESCSEHEEDVSPKEVNVVKNNGVKSEKSPEDKKKGTKKAKPPPSKGKQATLMNFFKKV